MSVLPISPSPRIHPLPAEKPKSRLSFLALSLADSVDKLIMPCPDYCKKKSFEVYKNPASIPTGFFDQCQRDCSLFKFRVNAVGL